MNQPTETATLRIARAVTLLTTEEKEVMLSALVSASERSESDTIRILIREAYMRLQAIKEVVTS